MRRGPQFKVIATCVGCEYLRDGEHGTRYCDGRDGLRIEGDAPEWCPEQSAGRMQMLADCVGERTLLHDATVRAIAHMHDQRPGFDLLACLGHMLKEQTANKEALVTQYAGMIAKCYCRLSRM